MVVRLEELKVNECLVRGAVGEGLGGVEGRNLFVVAVQVDGRMLCERGEEAGRRRHEGGRTRVLAPSACPRSLGESCLDGKRGGNKAWCLRAAAFGEVLRLHVEPGRDGASPRPREVDDHGFVDLACSNPCSPSWSLVLLQSRKLSLPINGVKELPGDSRWTETTFPSP